MNGRPNILPLVSVLINNYNYERFLAEAIDSALAQTYANVEVIVVDDGSTDGSWRIIESYGERVIPVFKPNGGQASAFDAGVAASRGEVLCFLDADDVWFPEKVERMVATLERYPEVGWVRHRLEIVDEKLSSLGARAPVFEGSREIPSDPYLYLEKRVAAPTSALSLRRSAASTVFPIATNGTAEKLVYDADAFVVVLLGTRAVCGFSLDEVLGHYRQHDYQRFAGPADVTRRLRRAQETGKLISAIWSEHMGIRRVPTHVYKLALILGALEGQPLWASERRTILMEGMSAISRLLTRHPKLAVRQTLALLSAFAAPEMWLRRLTKTRGLVG
jgi:glycosyltransferase involved in cell wall biosynthesis